MLIVAMMLACARSDCQCPASALTTCDDAAYMCGDCPMEQDEPAPSPLPPVCVVATPKVPPHTTGAKTAALAVTGPTAASLPDWVASNAVAEVTRILKARSRDELFVSLQLLGKYWQARGKNEASGNITIDEWPTAAGYNKWYHALRRRCEDTRLALRDEPESDVWPSAMMHLLAPQGKPTAASDKVHADFLRKCGKLARRAAKAAAPKNVVQHSTNAQPCVLAKSLKQSAADGNGNVPSAPASTPANARAASNAPRTRVFAGARDDSGATAHSNANAQLLCVPAKSFTPNAREGHIPTTEHHTNTPDSDFSRFAQRRYTGCKCKVTYRP